MRINNERGIAILTVVLIITIFTVLGTTLLGITLQAIKHRAVSDGQIEGKMLAEMGLLYFQKSLESIDPSPGLDIDSEVNNFLQQNFSTVDPSGKELFTLIKLGENKKGAFAIMYKVEKTVPISPNQPYSKKIAVSVIGIPEHIDENAESVTTKVRLDAVIYLNTIPAPFHHAVSTPNEVRLFGGSNIIGNISAGSLLTAKDYRTSEYVCINCDQTTNPNLYVYQDKPEVTIGQDFNQTYIEGHIFLDQNGDGHTKLYKVAALPEKDPIPLGDRIDINRQNLKTYFQPKTVKPSSEIISANPDKPYYPGYEPPVIAAKANEASSFTSSYDLENYIYKQFQSIPGASNKITLDREAQPIAIENHLPWIEGFSIFTPNLPYSSFVIETEQGNFRDEEHGFLLTTRLTGDQLTNTSTLFIGPRANSSGSLLTDIHYKQLNNASVEMGRSFSSFTEDPNYAYPSEIDLPFTFNGMIYIKGDLDIVGDININGSIFVDGNVVIREISNLEDKNLVILSTGKITISNRYVEETDSTNPSYVPVDQWHTLLPFSAYLYSERSIEIYSSKSFNWINGGIATGPGKSGQLAHIELNSLRESPANDLASRLVIQFNRRIFEEPTPGLRFHTDTLFTDTFDLSYSYSPQTILLAPR